MKKYQDNDIFCEPCNKDCNYYSEKDKHIKKVTHGPIGLKGEKGDTGATGPTGPTGPSGENLVIRSTNTLSPGEQANVTSYHDGNTTYLDFYIPKGFDGKPEKVIAGITKQVESNEQANVIDRYENATHYLDFSIPKGELGPKGDAGPKGDIGPQGIQGIAGPKGDKGEKGDTGPEGPKGEQGNIGPQGLKGDIGETGPQGPRGERGLQGEIGPTGPKGDKGDIGPRGLPGEIGRAEGISIDGIETTEPGEDAQVMDDFEFNIHHLTFYLPQGKQGPKGDKGESEVVRAGTTTQVGETESAKVEDRYENDIHYFDFQIPQGKTGDKGDRGPQGPQGIQGVAGPPGSTNNINTTVYNSESQAISNGRPLTYNKTLTNHALTINDSSVTITSNGTYIISFSINNGSTATAGDRIGIYNNGTLIEGTNRPITSSTNVSCTIVVDLNRNDIITLVPTISSGRTITNSGSPSAMLSVIQISG